jgi:hypothetical protein
MTRESGMRTRLDDTTIAKVPAQHDEIDDPIRGLIVRVNRNGPVPAGRPEWGVRAHRAWLVRTSIDALDASIAP